MNNNVGQQFEQLPLYSHEESSWPPAKEPHMMSPEEFENDPHTVFHASYKRLPREGETYRSTYRGIHAGTEQAALERIANLRSHHGGYSAHQMVLPELAPNADQQAREEQDLEGHARALRADRGMYDPPRAVVQAVNLKRYGVDNLTKPFSDSEANKRAEFDKPFAYTNAVEDPSSMSVVIPKRNPGPLTHEHYVDEAISQGRESEVHPTTMAMYKSGHLGMDVVDPDQVAKQLEENDLYNQHSDGLFPYETGHAENGKRVVDRLLSREDVKNIAGVYGDDKELDAADHESSPWQRFSKRVSYINQASQRANLSGDSAAADEIYQIDRATQPAKSDRLSERGDLRRGRQFTEVTP